MSTDATLTRAATRLPPEEAHPMYGIVIDPERSTTPTEVSSDALVWTALPDPVPAPGEVLIDVVAAGVNRADLLQRRGHYPPPPGASELIGLECSGRIAAVGSEVTTWQVGEPCVALLAGGGYAEQVAVPAGQVMPPPAGVDLVAAAGLVEVAATVVSNLDEVELAAGERFLVHGGAGGIGSFAIGWARHLGATVIATAGSPYKVRRCLDLGAQEAFSYRSEDPTWARRVADSGPVDVILDPIGARYLGEHVRLLGRGGRLVVIGLQGGRVAELDLAALQQRSASIRGTGLRGRSVAEKAAICRRLVSGVWPLLADGTLPLGQQQTVPITEASRAHDLLEHGTVMGKLILTV